MASADAGHDIRLYVALSLDGYLADADGGVGWLDRFSASGEDYGYFEMLGGCVLNVMGRATYDKVLTFGAWPYASIDSLVWTRSPLKAETPRTAAFHGDAAALGAELRRRSAEGEVYINGGGRLVRALLDVGAIDLIDLFVMPTLLGDGVPLFPAGRPTPRLDLVEHRAWPSGVVRVLYRVGGAG